MVRLFDPIDIRAVSIRNRAWVSPMCMYSSVEGLPQDWHLIHLGGMARGGAGLVMMEATGISPGGRITPGCAGLWSEEHVAAYQPITSFISSMGAVPAVQLSHAGRKASTQVLWEGGAFLPIEDGGWQTIGPSEIAFTGFAAPRAMTLQDIEEVQASFVSAALLALAAGFRVLELHAAHGYLIHQFLSPLSNERSDEYGGSLQNRCRFAVETATRVREAIGSQVPLFVRISATDWVPEGWTIEESVFLSRELLAVGVDLIDCSSGALIREADIDVRDGYQVPFARQIREEANIATAAVGLIVEPHAADEIITSGSADAVFLGRAMLRNPHWPLAAFEALGAPAPWPVQYRAVAHRPNGVS
jgi:2,4-dienoyl-CoA reductase-like NADH-dependent reductase (Old Yellow Enzyme family)